MSEIPPELKYSTSHEWCRLDDADTVTIGITDHAQSQLGDLVFVDLPDDLDSIHVGDEIAVVESVKTASDIYSPVSGKIIEINEELKTDPAKVNQDPYGDGWLFKVKLADKTDLNGLMSADDYEHTIE